MEGRRNNRGRGMPGSYTYAGNLKHTFALPVTVGFCPKMKHPGSMGDFYSSAFSYSVIAGAEREGLSNFIFWDLQISVDDTL